MPKRAELEHESRRHHTRRPTPAPFIGHWTLAFLALPFVGTVFFMVNDGIESIRGTRRITYPWGAGHWDIRIGMFDHKLGDLIIGLTLLTACGLVAVVLGIGKKVTQRIPFVVYHVAATCMLAGLLLWGTTALGWAPWWIVLHVFGSAFMAFSWNFYRIDALRSAAQSESTGSEPSKWEELIGLKSQPVMAEAVVTENAITVPIEHRDGETLADLQGRTGRIESLARAVPNRTRAIMGSHAGRSTLTIITSDMLRETWRQWPGLSHPGQSFAMGIRTAYRDDGSDQWFWFAPELKVAKMLPIRKRGRTSIGRQGTTGAGKSGDSNNEQLEVCSRCDVLPIIVDVDKFSQNAGWVGDQLWMAANTAGKANAVSRAIVRMAEVRQARLARYGFREWVPEAYTHPQCRTPAIYLFYDEADSVLGKLARWIAAKGLAAGIFGSYTIPSADGESMPPRLRRSVGAWKCFGCGDGYAATFVLQKKTFQAATNPGEWGAQFPGAHLLDGAPNVDPRLYPVTSRSYANEHRDMRAELLEAKQHFAPVVAHKEDEDAAGDALESCHPRFLPPMDLAGGEQIDNVDLAKVQANVREVVRVQGTPPPSKAPAGAEFDLDDDEDLLPDDDGHEEIEDVKSDTDVYDQAELDRTGSSEENEMEIADRIREKVTNRKPQPTQASTRLSAEDRAALADIDPRQPMAADAGGPPASLTGPPEVSEEDAAVEFKRVLVEMAREGKTEFTSQEIIGRLTKWSGSGVSRMMTSLCGGDAVTPPGVSIKRIGTRGKFAIVWEGVPELTASN